MSGEELADTAQQCSLAGVDLCVTGFRVGGEDTLVDLRVDVAENRERLGFRREGKGAPPVGVQEGLLAETVPRTEEHTAPRVPDREGEHPVQLGQTVRPPLRVGAQQDFGGGLAPEAVAEAAQAIPKLDEVVDLAVVGDRESRLGIQHGLVAALGEVEDRQPAVAQDAPSVG